jgi:Ca2+-binding RTX toxin-like protein
LSHPGRYNAGEGGPITYANSAEYAQDTRRFTIMSYFDADEDGSGTDMQTPGGRDVFPSTPMLHDVLAVQALYGADMTTRTGDTTYGFNVSKDLKDRPVFDFTKNINPIVTIWDAGGRDTIDVSGFSTNQIVDLREGGQSSVGEQTNNLFIAFGAVIENAIGGPGSDWLIGNDQANRLVGGKGADTLEGKAGGDILRGERGADTLIGGDGSDILFGGKGADTFVFDVFGEGTQGLDRIKDFNPRADLIAFDDAVFTALGAPGALVAGAFALGRIATETDDRILYDRKNGYLYYDADGSGGLDAVAIAKLAGRPALSASDILII